LDSRVVFVLVGARSPGNVGAVCRVAKTFGFPVVRLVSPRLTADPAEAQRLAHGAEDVLEAMPTHATLPEAVVDCFRSIATTARRRDWTRPVHSPGDLAGLADADSGRPLALVFGPEDRGLTNEELSVCDEIVSIPLPDDAGASLSLPAAAAILAYELSRGGEGATDRPAGRSDRSARGSRPLETAELDSLLDEIGASLDEIGFRPRPNAVRFRGSLRDFLARARPTLGDRLFLRHLFAQIGKWKRRVASEARRASAPRGSRGS
jgi:TrmH family RNA methyltransferase